MNPQETRAFIDFVRKARDELGLTVLLIEHDMKVILEVSERVTVLDYGQKIAEGGPSDVVADERVREAYLGKQGGRMSAPAAAAPSAAPMLELDDVHVYYGSIHALKGVSLRVEAGRIVTLLGANGAGKSTTLRTISGLQRPRKGGDPLRGRRHHPEQRADDRQAGHRPIARGPAALRPDDRAREPRDGRLPAH